ncbi:MAG: 50S ribosomal protein L32 [Patescibacteria group bacterium]
MSKKPVPKKKMSKSRSKQRYGSFQTKVLKRLSNETKLVTCKNCGSKHVSHTVCPDCGKYRERQVVDKSKKVAKITKIKA